LLRWQQLTASANMGFRSPARTINHDEQIGRRHI
jgi:hypothetical protein